MKCRGRLCVSRRGFVPSQRDCAANDLQQAEQASSPPKGYTTTTTDSRDDGEASSGRLRGQQSSSEPRQRRQQGGLSKPKIPTVAQDIPILVRRVVHTMVPRTCLMFVPNRPVVVDVQSPRDREDPISKYAHCPPSWSSIRGICGEGRSVTSPSGCDMTASPLGWCLGSAWQYRRRDMSPVLVMCR